MVHGCFSETLELLHECGCAIGGDHTEGAHLANGPEEAFRTKVTSCFRCGMVWRDKSGTARARCEGYRGEWDTWFCECKCHAKLPQWAFPDHIPQRPEMWSGTWPGHEEPGGAQ